MIQRIFSQGASIMIRIRVSKVYSAAANWVYPSRYILCNDVIGDGPVEGPHLLALQDDGGGWWVEAKLAPQLDCCRVLDARLAVAPVSKGKFTLHLPFTGSLSEGGVQQLSFAQKPGKAT